VTYKYLYQDKENKNLEGEIKARNRADAYQLLRKQGIRPYRLIGDDPWNWRPWAVGAGYAVLLTTIVVLVILLGSKISAKPSHSQKNFAPLTAEEAQRFRDKAEEAVYRAPEAYRYNVWKGVNARLAERGLETIPLPEGLVEE